MQNAQAVRGRARARGTRRAAAAADGGTTGAREPTAHKEERLTADEAGALLDLSGRRVLELIKLRRLVGIEEGRRRWTTRDAVTDYQRRKALAKAPAGPPGSLADVKALTGLGPPDVQPESVHRAGTYAGEGVPTARAVAAAVLRGHPDGDIDRLAERGDQCWLQLLQFPPAMTAAYLVEFYDKIDRAWRRLHQLGPGLLAAATSAGALLVAAGGA